MTNTKVNGLPIFQTILIQEESKYSQKIYQIDQLMFLFINWLIVPTKKRFTLSSCSKIPCS